MVVLPIGVCCVYHYNYRILSDLGRPATSKSPTSSMNMQLLLSKAEIIPDQAPVSARLLILLHSIRISVRNEDRKEERVCLCVCVCVCVPFLSILCHFKGVVYTEMQMRPEINYAIICSCLTSPSYLSFTISNVNCRQKNKFFLNHLAPKVKETTAIRRKRKKTSETNT